VRLLALTGCRRGEIERLRWAEVDLPGRCLRLSDSKEGKSVRPLGAMRASKLEIKTKSGLAIGKVGDIIDVTTVRNHSIRVLHEPAPDNKAHAAVRRWPRDDMALLELIAAEAWSELVLNIDVPEGLEAAPDQSAWVPPA
jgi:integrase